ncbi:MAG: hypothetical protein KAT14_07465 [Candidatus Marinimicrobia bacterium]|nr:hypothetical protein [Candidatus Neomarinimicrobiota bacterium]
MSQTYSFKNVNVFLTIDLGIPVGFIPVGIPINLSASNFFGKEGAITVTPNPNAILSDEISIDGVSLPDVSNDLSGTMTIRVGDMSGAHFLLSSLFTFHKQGLLVRKIGINILQKPVGTGSDILEANILYTGNRGSIRGLPNKSFGNRQSGNEFLFNFEKVSGGTTIGLVGNLLQIL